MKKKINKEKSVVFSNWCVPVKLGTKGTFVDDFDYPDSYFEGGLCGVRADTRTPFLDKYGNWYKYFVPEDLGEFKDEPDTKDYRPFFGLADLPFNLGDKITYRSKDHPHPSKAIVTSIEYKEEGSHELYSISLGALDYEPEELFMGYELFNESTNTWEPFGVKLQVVDVRDLKGNK